MSIDQGHSVFYVYNSGVFCILCLQFRGILCSCPQLRGISFLESIFLANFFCVHIHQPLSLFILSVAVQPGKMKVLFESTEIKKYNERLSNELESARWDNIFL